MRTSLSNWLQGYEELCSSLESPDIYNTWCGVSTIAAALQRRVYLPWDQFIYPNFYTVLIGPAGCRKSTAMYPAKTLLDRLNIATCAETITREALIKALVSSAQSLETPDGLIEVHNSLTCICSELAVFLKSGDPDFISLLCNLYDNPAKFKYTTLKRGEELIEAAWLNLLGAITPKLLQTSLPSNAVGSGLTSRMIFVYAHKKSKDVIYPKINTKLLDALTKDLNVLSLLSGEYSPTEEFLEVYEPWYRENERVPAIADLNFEAYCSRRPTHLRKLCMILSAAKRQDLLITGDDFMEALGMLKKLERSMSETFRGYGRSTYADIIPRLMEFIAIRGTVTLSTLTREFYRDATLMELEEMITTLKQMKVVDQPNTAIPSLRWTGDKNPFLFQLPLATEITDSAVAFDS